MSLVDTVGAKLVGSLCARASGESLGAGVSGSGARSAGTGYDRSARNQSCLDVRCVEHCLIRRE